MRRWNTAKILLALLVFFYLMGIPAYTKELPSASRSPGWKEKKSEAVKRAWASGGQESGEEEEAKPTLVTTTLVLVKGGKESPIVVTGGEVQRFISYDETVCTVAADGLVIPMETGNTSISLEVLGKDGWIYYFTCYVSVIDPQLSERSIDMLLNKEAASEINVLGLSQYVRDMDILCTVDNPEVIEISNVSSYSGKIRVVGKKAGKAVITINICGKKLTCKIKVRYYKLKQNSMNLRKGIIKTLKVTGTKEKVKWSVTNSKVASISSKGVLKIKRNGNTTVKAKVGGITLKCYISVTNQKAIAAVKKAKSVIGAVYSQEKRMQKGFYDCSSLIWRSYQPYGVTFGNKNWAPTAADQAKWCVANGKVIAEQGLPVEKRKLLPGDLIFYSRESNQNGRYKNIYHVAMFAGYQAEYYDPANPAMFGLVVEADGRYVSERKYTDDFGIDKKIVLIARPLK